MFLALSPSLASAQVQVCGSMETIVRGLNERFKEYVRISMLTSTKVAIQIFISESGVWTIIAIGPKRTCILSFGDNYKEIEWATPRFKQPSSGIQ